MMHFFHALFHVVSFLFSFFFSFHFLASWSDSIGILWLALNCATTIAATHHLMVARTKKVGVRAKKRWGWGNSHREKGSSVGGWCPFDKWGGFVKQHCW
jgi:hypothetical protein